ncbi:MAG: hypothetical protein ACJAVI_005531 [Candidatus Azotimanducaceae bacterium]|jgi:hypothetical protein
MNPSSQLRTAVHFSSRPDITPGVFAIEDIMLAIDWAKSSPQYRIPRNRMGGPWKVVHPSYKVRNHPDRAKGFIKILEGKLEGDYCLVLEFDHTIEAYACQPFKIIGGHYWGFNFFTPDVVIYPFDAPPVVIDCKPLNVAQAKIHKERHDRLREAFNTFGVEFAVVTDDIIQQQPRLHTYQFLYPRLCSGQQHLIGEAKALHTKVLQLGGAAEVQDLRELGVDVVRRGFAYAHSMGALSSDFEHFYGPEFLIYTT